MLKFIFIFKFKFI